MRRNFILFLLLLLQISYGFSAEKDLPEISQDSVSIYVAEARIAAYNDFPEALLLLQKAASFAKEPEEISEVDYAYGVVYYIKGDYDKSLNYFLKALKAFREEGDHLGIAKGLVGQGLIQQAIHRHAEAINFFRKAIEAYENAFKIEEANPAYLNIALSEMELGNFDAARRDLEKAIDLSREVGRKDVEHMGYNKLGELNFRINKPDEAIYYYWKVLEDDTEPNNWEKSFAHSGLAQTYLQQQNIALAEEHGVKAVEFSKETHSLWDLERNTRILSEVYAEKGAMGMAHEFLKKNREYKDSLYNREKIQEINLLQLESQEAENLRLQAEKEIAEKQLFINKIVSFLLILITLFLILLLVLFRRNTRQKEKFNRELEEKNRIISEKNELILKRNEELDEIDKAKNRLFSILSHDLKSPIGSIQQLLEMMKSEEFSPEEQAGLLDEMLKQITGTSFMLHNLLYWAGSQLDGNKIAPEKVDMPSEVEKAMDAHYWPAKRKGISVLHDPKEHLSEVVMDKAQLSIILHNLISNAIKFTPEGGSIELKYKDQGEMLQLIVKDEGKGLSKEKIAEIKSLTTRMLSKVGTDMETGTGLGLLLVKDFLKANRAELDITSEPGKGSEFRVSFIKAPQDNI